MAEGWALLLVVKMDNM
jgi:hypothetical protein